MGKTMATDKGFKKSFFKKKGNCRTFWTMDWQYISRSDQDL